MTGATGKVALAPRRCPDAVLGSVVTFDMAATGHEDVLVPMYPTSGAPTAQGVDVARRRHRAVITSFATNLGFQNSPLVTDDPTGSIGITVAGYGGATDVGWIEHYAIPGTNGAAAVGNGAWPEFHHDPQLTGQRRRHARRRIGARLLDPVRRPAGATTSSPVTAASSRSAARRSAGRRAG